jgi:ribosomal protein S12 methylthiotransferase accessory factor
VAVRKALHEFAAARARKVLMHGPLDLVERATPPGYLDGWLSGHPPERLVEEDRALQAVLSWSRQPTAALVDLLQGSVLSRRSTVRFTDLPTASPADLHADLLQRLQGDGLDVLLSVQPSQGEAVAAKALVPGLEVETMSYGRIGERGVRRLLERGDPLVAVGERPPGFAQVHLTADAQERLGGPAWFDRAGADARVGPLYALYREPGRHVVGALQRAAA